MSRRRVNHITYTSLEEARTSARAWGFRSLKQAAWAFNISLRQAVMYRPWEYAELQEEPFRAFYI